MPAGQPSVAARTGGALLGWGDGHDGQLGNGHRTNVQSTPVRVRLPRGVTVISVRAGCEHTLALTSTGRVLAWGFNVDGELGDGSRTSTDTPVWVKLPKGTKIKAVRAGCDQSLALTTTGQVLAWGFNEFGELGTGTTTDSNAPVRVSIAPGQRVIGIGGGPFASALFAIVHKL